MKDIKAGEIKSLIEDTGRITLIDFSASWCGPCQMVHPVLEALSSEMLDKVSIYRVDVDESQAEASAMGVRGVPTMIFFHGGKEIDRQVGFREKADLRKVMDDLVERYLNPGNG